MRRRSRLTLLAAIAILGSLAAVVGGDIPLVIHSDRGDIKIVWVKHINCSGVDSRGCYSDNLRQVWIITGMSHDSTLQTIRHEQCHASLADAGIEVDSITHTRDSIFVDQGGPEDYVCDALAWAWLHEKQHGH